MYLVTGATGNVGCEVVAQLLAAGLPTRVFIRNPANVVHLQGRAEIAVGEFTNRESLARALKGTNGVYLVASGTTTDSFAQVLDTLIASGAPPVVFISGSVAGWLESSVGAWFREREEMFRSSRLPWTILRPCDFMTNTYQWKATVKREGVVYNSTGDAKMALIAPEDVAAVAVECLRSSEWQGQTIALTGGELLSVPQQINILAEVLNRPLRCVDVSVEMGVEHLIRSGMPEAAARSTGEIFELTRSGKAEIITGDFAKIAAKAPKTFRAWVQDHAAEFC